MFNLKRKEEEIVIQEVKRPKPQLVVVNYPLTEYEKTAKELNFLPAALLHKQILQFLSDEKIFTYDFEKVMKYLWSDVEKLNKNLIKEKNRSESLLKVIWIPLRYEDGWDSRHEGFGWHGSANDKNIMYDKLIPAHILKDVQKIENKFENKVKFFVSDYEVVNPDPFIMVTANNMNHIIFGVWDEPGFV